MLVGGGVGRDSNFYAITFSYKVDGQYYSGEFTVASALNYKEGGTIEVKYNPVNPEQNDLDGRGESAVWINRAVTVVGVAFLLYIVAFRGCATH